MTALAYIAAAIFSIGIAGCTFAMLRSCLEDFGPLGTAMIGMAMVPLLGALVWVLFVTISEQAGPDIAPLKKDEWACTASHRVTTPMLVGKIMVPQTRTVCDQYERRDR